MLSRVERGLTSPSIETLAKIAAGLKMPMAALFDDDVAFWAMVVRDASSVTDSIRHSSIPALALTGPKKSRSAP